MLKLYYKTIKLIFSYIALKVATCKQLASLNAFVLRINKTLENKIGLMKAIRQQKGIK